ncbi:MAG: hypothetical protein DDT20_01069 [Firmicutes bacterium]|nr:hypothetical protein [Bacillota bacterium]
MFYLYVLAAAAVALVVWRMRAPADLRINRRYLARFMTDSTGRGPRKVELVRIPVWLKPSELEEHAYFHVEADFTDGSTQQVTVQILYPLESLQREREQQQKPLMAEDFNVMQNPARLGGHSQDDAAKFKEDPLRELTAERKLIEQKTAQFDREVEQLRCLNSCGNLFPRLIAYDRAQHIAILTPVGGKRLDTALHESPPDARLQLLQDVLVRLAVFHASSGSLPLDLPSKGNHTEQVIRAQLANALPSLVSASVLAEQADVSELLVATAPIWSAGANFSGIRLADPSPRALYVYNGVVRPLNYGQLRRDITLLDAIELLCDPAVPLTPEEEFDLFKHYLSARFPAEDDQSAVLVELLRLAVYYRLVLAQHLAEYFAVLERSHDKRGSLSIPYWNNDARRRNLAALHFYLAHDSDLVRLKQALQ